MPGDFYLPEDPEYTIADSARDSVRFAHFCLEPTDEGRWRPIASAVDPDGRPVASGLLANLEGPGTGSDGIGGALLLYRWARFDQNHILENVALGLLDHYLQDGFVDSSGLLRAYRNRVTGQFQDSARPNDDRVDPSSVARPALHLLRFADDLPADDARAEEMRRIALRSGEWLADHLQAPAALSTDRRIPPADLVGIGPVDQLLSAWLWLELEGRGLGSDSNRAIGVMEALAASAEGMSHSVGDVGAWNSSLAHALAFRVARRTAKITDSSEIAKLGRIGLMGLNRFQICADRGGAPVRGFVESFRGTGGISVGDNAECAIAFLEAFEDSGNRDHLCSGITILRAIARNHKLTAAPHGFLPADLPASAGNRQTEPLGSNLAHLEPALWILTRHGS